MTARFKRYTAEQVAETIGIPLTEWPGNCYGIASAMVEHGLVKDGVAVYGHWLGDVHPRSMFYPKWEAVRFCQHGWIRLDNDNVIDPTRFVFENAAPYIYEGNPSEGTCLDFDPVLDDEDYCECRCPEDDHKQGFFRPCTNCVSPYDEGGNTIREALMSPFPTAMTGNIVEAMDWGSSLAREVVCALADRDPNNPEHVSRWAVRQLMWIANLPPRRFGKAVEDIYRAIVAAGHPALIPQDNYDMVLGKTRPKKRAKR
jgi:hypothetical protein